MFDKLKQAFGLVNKNNVILAPIEGYVCPLSEVSDPTFSQEILGKGVAIKPKNGRVVSPVNGTVTIMFETKHALSITTDTGVELLIHIGLDTVKLKGEHFKSYIKAEDKVKVGDLLLEFDIDKIREAGYDVISPIIICNSADYAAIDTSIGKDVNELDEIINIKN